MTTLEEQAHRNLCDFTVWCHGLEPEGRSIDRLGVVGLAAGPDSPSGRTLVRRTAELAPEAWADAAEAFVFADGKTACCFSRIGADDDIAAVLLARGFTEYATTPEMVCEDPLAARPDPTGFRVRLARTPADVLAYAAVAGEAFAHLGMPAESVQHALERHERLLVPEVAVAVAESGDGKIVAGAMSVLLGPDANGYVGWVACADSARGHGLGDAVTRRVTNDAFDRGAPLVTLEASRFGENTYARMGYRELYRYRLLIKV